MANKSAARKLMSHNKDKNKGKSAFFMGSDDGLLSDIPYWIPSGCTPLDAIIGGGIPGGRMIEVYGDEATAKSLIALYVIGQCQAMGGIGLLLDPEATSTMKMARLYGVDTDELIVGYPNTIEELYDVHMTEFLDAKIALDKEEKIVTPAVIVWDSIASTIPVAELNSIEKKGLGKATMAEHARAISKMLRVLPRELSRAKTTGFFINQTREKLGVLYGDKTVTPGGKALKFYASLRIELKIKKVQRDENKKAFGVEIQATIVKNKVGRPFGRCRFPVIFDQGINNAIACFWYLKDLEIITVTGAWHHIELDGKDVRFYEKDWITIFNDHEDTIKDMVITGEIPLVDKKEYAEEEEED